ncbi:MAG: carbon-nitrogen hydrolase family protein [Candidatus Latescibacterota bacterium]
MELRIAGAQIAVTRDLEANAAAVSRAIEFARQERADVLLTPEGSVSGYTHTFDAAAVSRSVEALVDQARQARVGLALGTCYVESDGRCYNQVRFYAPDGRYLGFHSKTLTCGTMTEPPQGEIEQYAVAPLRTFELAGVRVGGLICNDLWANPGCTPQPDPHLTQQLSRLGARIVFHAVNGGRDGSAWSEVGWRFHEANLQMRARAGRLWVVTVDNCDPDRWPCSAPSGVVDPQGEWAYRARPRGEELFAFTVRIDDH